MIRHAVRPPKLTGTPEWIFQWREKSLPWFPKLLATAIVAGGFTLLLPLKVRVAELPKLRRGVLP
ncbi:MAG: hypothetical protein HC845_06170 [Akkermansiaceae bacterium]|nr:hypothetical protein [Akkermansiaceae bacterium]